MRKLISLVVLFLSLILFSGCSPVEQEFLQKYYELSKWKALQDTTTIHFNAMLIDENLDYSVVMDTYQDIEAKQVKFVISGKSNSDKIPGFDPIEFLFDEEAIYFRGNDIANIANTFQIPLSEKEQRVLAKIKDQHIVLKYSEIENMVNSDNLAGNELFSAEMIKQSMFEPEKTYGMLLLLPQAFPEFSMGMIREGDTYIININNSNIVDLIDKYALNSIKNIDKLMELSMVNPDLKQSIAEISPEERAAMLEEYEKFAPEMKEMLQSKIDLGELKIAVKFEFLPQSAKSNIDISAEYFDLPEPVYGNIDFDLSINSLAKMKKNSIAMPEPNKQASAIKVINEMKIPEKKLIIYVDNNERFLQFYDAKPTSLNFGIIFSEDATEIPAVEVLTALNENPVWHDGMKAYYISTPNGPIVIDGQFYDQNGQEKFFISPWELTKLGYNVIWNYQDRCIQISK